MDDEIPIGTLGDFQVGDVITIPSTQYRRPMHELNRVTRQPTGQLRAFVVVEVTDGAVKLRPK
jgi:hypothetical protein